MSKWYEDFYTAVDSMDPAALGARCTDDTRVQMGNHEPIVGREAMLAAITGLWSTIGGLRHELRTVIEDGDTACIEALVHYTRLDGSKVTLPAVTMIRRERGRVADQRIYIDIAPLHTGG